MAVEENKQNDEAEIKRVIEGGVKRQVADYAPSELGARRFGDRPRAAGPQAIAKRTCWARKDRAPEP